MYIMLNISTNQEWIQNVAEKLEAEGTEKLSADKTISFNHLKDVHRNIRAFMGQEAATTLAPLDFPLLAPRFTVARHFGVQLHLKV